MRMFVATEASQAHPATALWVCAVCEDVYDPQLGDPEGGIAAGTAFEDIPDDWVCPVCGARKKEFRKMAPGEEFQHVREDLAGELA